MASFSPLIRVEFTPKLLAGALYTVRLKSSLACAELIDANPKVKAVVRVAKVVVLFMVLLLCMLMV